MAQARHRASTSAGRPRSLGAEWNDDDGTWLVRRARPGRHRGSTLARPGRHHRGRPAQPAAASPTSTAPTPSTGRRSTPPRWDHSVDLTGKRVALIGAGASGFQIAPAIADQVEHLTVFQRTAQWMFPNPIYHERSAAGVRWAMRHLPFYGRWYRFLLFWPGCDKGLEAARIDPDYPDDPNYAVSEMQRRSPA